MFMHGIGHHLQRWNIIIAPDVSLKKRREVTSMVDLCFFGADHAPASLRFHAAHGGQSLGHTPAKSIAVRYLIESIRCSDGPDLDRFKKDVITGWHFGFLKLR